MPLESIRSLVQSDLEAIDQFICNELQSEIPLINELVEYILNCGGKRIRPLVVLLSARTFHHQKNQHIDLAAAIELIHTATLLHDDVVDRAEMRRGRKTAHMIWGNEASILVGDFLYSRAFQLVVKQNNPTVLKLFSDATNLIAEGEVMQLINCGNPSTTEADYFTVIERKTAKLFEIASQLGPAISAANPQELATMKHYGFHLGMAYQLIDDALDYRSSPEETGKNLGNDLAEGKPTLPLIFAIQNATPAEKALLHDAITNNSNQNLDTIIGIIESTQAIEYTARAAKNHAQQAISTLHHVPDSPYRKALHDLTEFVVDRNY